jgi:hypothetical protein
LNWNHVDLDATGRQPVEQALDEPLRLVVLEEGAVQEVDADDPQRLVLARRLDVEHPYVQHDLARLVARVGLELHAHPAVALVAAVEAPRHHGVGEGEEGGRVAPAVLQPRDVELVLMVEHRLQASHGHVPIGLAVDGVADGHVVGGHRLGDRPGRPSDLEEPPDHLLAGADLGDGPVPARIEVDP